MHIYLLKVRYMISYRINVCCQVSGPVPVTAIQVPCQHNMKMNSENKMKGENLFYVMYMHIWS